MGGAVLGGTTVHDTYPVCFDLNMGNIHNTYMGNSMVTYVIKSLFFGPHLSFKELKTVMGFLIFNLCY